MTSKRVWACALLVPLIAHAGGVNKCVRADGRVTFSDKTCPGSDRTGSIKARINSYSSGESTRGMRGYLGATAAARVSRNVSAPAESAESAPPTASAAPPPAPAPDRRY